MNAPSTHLNSERWAPFKYFLGSWQGVGEGRPGQSELSRTYRLILQDRFLQIRHRSDYPPQERNPEGERHEELGLIGFDEQRGRYVFREFHVEGYVIQYVLEEEPGGDALTFISEAFENFAPGWRARTIYQITNDDEFQETFDLAGPGRPWTTLMTNVFRRMGV